mmetsp:Transcript_58763/g.164900  ORF Transcript_58763/g.164900 Transcript_58763/m.164900 type:complete len:253 (+) Transcript_58763:1204-1962(+)
MTSSSTGTIAPLSMSVRGRAVAPAGCATLTVSPSGPSSGGKFMSGSGMSKPASMLSMAPSGPPSGNAGGGAAPPPMAVVMASFAGVVVPNKASNFSGNVTLRFELPQYCFRKTSTPGHTCALTIDDAALAGAPSPKDLHSKDSRFSNIVAASLCARFKGMSPLKTRLRSSAIGKWLSSKPFAPPASNAAAIRRKDGSLCSSDSRVCWMMLASFFSSVFTPQMRRFFEAGPLPSSPSLSSPSISAELSPPSTL